MYADISCGCYVKQPNEAQKAKIAKHIEKMNELAEKGPYVEGVMAKYYAPKEGEVCFFTRENALIIDTLRNYTINIYSVSNPKVFITFGLEAPRRARKTRTVF